MNDEYKYYNKIFDELYPVHRSIAGPGLRKVLKILNKYIKIKVIKIPSGKKIFDWVVPNEWELIRGYIKFKNKIIIDGKKNNLSIINGSAPIKKNFDLQELKKNIFTHPILKNAIPYVTSYYKKNWGFCMSENSKKKLKKGKYFVEIKTKTKKGFLNYGEAKISGKSNKIFLMSSFLCHPSMANNELSGPLTLIGLHKKIKKWKHRNLNYNFLLNPETIGSIAYINKNLSFLKKKQKVHSGMVLTCMGGSYDKLSYFKSRHSKSGLDRLVDFFSSKKKYKIFNFNPAEGGDERQFCSSALNLPIGRFERNGKGHYKEYHTDHDNKKIMGIDKIIDSVESLNTLLKYNDYIFPIVRYEKYCELFLSKRLLYPSTNSFLETKKKDRDLDHKIIISLLSYADGKHDYLDITLLFNFPIDRVLENLKFLINKKLVYLKLK